MLILRYLLHIHVTHQARSASDPLPLLETVAALWLGERDDAPLSRENCPLTLLEMDIQVRGCMLNGSCMANWLTGSWLAFWHSGILARMPAG